ncbi:DNA repair protein RecO [Thermomicrobiaceae bacterium CFH 74404]|uniref:DNA repair protein RecO n=1 Tax=Thermalbibacter longus TaxID=2951981 RepID=A0AA41WEB7_9BACT|nr:DNA repair protein RecO [Thermalbibacter longus]MCM8748460.1 DNA repair protein RecO [Thermalbibacter longus]
MTSVDSAGPVRSDALASNQESRIRLYRVEAVVLRRWDLGEADRILNLYTRQRGKLRAVAKGVRRPTSRLAGHLELFAHSNVLIARGRDLEIVSQAELIEPFRDLRRDERRIGLAGYVADLLDALTSEDDPQPLVFELLTETLRGIASQPDPFFVVRRYELRLLGALGYQPELYRCVVCGRPLEPVTNAFAPQLGGVACPPCAARDPAAVPLPVGAVKALRLLAGERWATVLERRTGPELRSAVESALYAYTRHILGRELASRAVLDQLQLAGSWSAGSPSPR